MGRGDITYLPLVGGRWCFLATWRDTCSRRAVGWHLDQQMPTELVLTGLDRPRAGADAAPASSWPDYPRRPGQPIHQLSVPGTHRTSSGTGQLQPAGYPLR
ncbi:DDE-type integrase/transposase/recombinase [Hymenobacter bucti]|uniref:DDE-type integrase/transposase/recombinase n=1 Tax=Hymenobacter bucti TaxID=1844114 RepID=A0ABW4QZ68_9BACT